ncbi:hypothetical protein A3B35_02290 [Candidatus Kaiserbacteria bacterium RIFCSPLOWO2_01_FULL_54_24]|uniref:Uncharacterized protein n=1 Tax=Candidatus Kaiserbacteria bacterium RIFCSPLOWO2_01_FULL_54_24 TaxID=1798515 RepID=A0A1F6EW45_9BACT|nr:MAG: hypothetical protein A3B35_02290 [Candidatus Kaiserbacteria bacterium RIFCSPLOWO2_01_FULL_54_24]
MLYPGPSLVIGILFILFGLAALYSKGFDAFLKRNNYSLPTYKLTHWGRSEESLERQRRWEAVAALVLGLFIVTLWFIVD